MAYEVVRTRPKAHLERHGGEAASNLHDFRSTHDYEYEPPDGDISIALFSHLVVPESPSST